MMTNTDTTGPRSPSSEIGISLFWLTVATLGLLLLVELARAWGCWSSVMAIIIFAYPIWLARREGFLFNRRLLLTGLTIEDGVYRRLFWHGRIGTSFRVGTALVSSTILLALGLRLGAEQWGLIFADAVFVALCYGWYRRHAAGEVRPEVLGIFVRGWPLWFTNLAILTAAFALLSFFVVGAPDLRATTWDQAAARAFQETAQSVECPLVGQLVGLFAALDEGTWTLAQQLIPGLPGAEWRLAAWLLFLLQLGLLPAALTSCYFGILGLVEDKRRRADSFIGDSPVGKTFIVTILVLAALSMYPVMKLRDLRPEDFKPTHLDLVKQIDPCRQQPEITSQAKQAQTALNDDIRARSEAFKRDMRERIGEKVDALFRPVEAGVEPYLDWYYTVIGEYERLAALAVGNFPELMMDQLNTHLFESTGFSNALARTVDNLNAETIDGMSGIAPAIHEQLKSYMDANPCFAPSANPETLIMPTFRNDIIRSSVAVSGGVAAGTATLAAATVAKIAAKKSVQAAATLAAKTAAKKGGSALIAATGGAAVCAGSVIGAPAAPVCGMVAALAAWIVIDKVAIEIDETITRDEMRADILAAIEEQKAALKEEYDTQLSAFADTVAANIQATVDGVFIPARDGL